jgi:hypothetical protein
MQGRDLLATIVDETRQARAASWRQLQRPINCARLAACLAWSSGPSSA